MKADERFYREAIPLLTKASEIEAVTIHTNFRSFDASGATMSANLMRGSTEHEVFVLDPAHITGITILWADEIQASAKDIDAILMRQKDNLNEL